MPSLRSERQQMAVLTEALPAQPLLQRTDGDDDAARTMAVGYGIIFPG